MVSRSIDASSVCTPNDDIRITRQTARGFAVAIPRSRWRAGGWVGFHLDEQRTVLSHWGPVICDCDNSTLFRFTLRRGRSDSQNEFVRWGFVLTDHHCSGWRMSLSWCNAANLSDSRTGFLPTPIQCKKSALSRPPNQSSSLRHIPPAKLAPAPAARCAPLFTGSCSGQTFQQLFEPNPFGMLQHDSRLNALLGRTRQKNQTDARLDRLVHKLNLTRQGTIAVVGSSGSLLHHVHGKQIDAHTVVIRVNGAITQGYERHVGRRTDLRVAWDLGIVDMRNRQQLHQDLWILRTIPFLTVGAPCPPLFSAALAARRNVTRGHRLNTSAQQTPWEHEAMGLASRVRGILRLRARWVSELGGGEKMLRCACHFPSTGFVAIAVAVALAKQANIGAPSVYGYGNSEQCYKYDRSLHAHVLCCACDAWQLPTAVPISTPSGLGVLRCQHSRYVVPCDCAHSTVGTMTAMAATRPTRTPMMPWSALPQPRAAMRASPGAMRLGRRQCSAVGGNVLA